LDILHLYNLNDRSDAGNGVSRVGSFINLRVVVSQDLMNYMINIWLRLSDTILGIKMIFSSFAWKETRTGNFKLFTHLFDWWHTLNLLIRRNYSVFLVEWINKRSNDVASNGTRDTLLYSGILNQVSYLLLFRTVMIGSGPVQQVRKALDSNLII
jgi:hypothetical protein